MKRKERGNSVEAYRSKGRFPVLEIAKINLRHNSLFSIASAVILCLLVPLLTGTANLDRSSAALPLEMFVSLIGIVLLTPIFQPEQNEEIDDLISSKYCSMGKVHWIRVVYSLMAAVVLIVLFAGYMRIQGCDVTPALVLGTAADALFLGSIGMLTSALSDSTVIGYMPPLLYYVLNISVGPKLGCFYLFSMTAGDYSTKFWLFAAGTLMLSISLIGKWMRRQMR